jgi:hypothetical protein
MRESLSPLGQLRTVGEWALHIQCPWRIRQRGRLVVASGDIYYSPSGEPLDDWDKPRNSKFDVTAAKLCDEFSVAPPFVVAIGVDDVGGFSIEIANDYRFDVFPNCSIANDEHWRLFQPGVDDSHFVFPLEDSGDV